jgi:nucleotide-binding universal stress UspA family protein
MEKIANILVPVAGNPVDEAAISLACRVAKESKGRVYIIYVIEVKRSLPLDAELQSEVQRGEEVLDHAEQVAEDLGYEVDTELLQAREVGPAVVDEAIERGVNLIVIGIPYKKRFGEFNLGRTTPYVLKNAPCQVWVVRQAIMG